MGIKVALEHRTAYRFDRPTDIGPHLIRLRPAPHCRTPIEAYSLTVTPADHFVNWQQDPFGNHVARFVFPTRARELEVTVGLVADLGVINPFDFFVEDYATRYPFSYPPDLAADLAPYLVPVGESVGAGPGPLLQGWLGSLDVADQGLSVVDFLVALNSAVYQAVGYSVRMEVGVQSPDVTLGRAIGSCRDSAWLLVAALRHHGLAARFVSGYLVQLAADQQPLAGPAGPSEDFTDLHAWAEAFVPGAGWVGLDPTSALLTGEGHIPLAATPHPNHAAPIVGATGPTEVTFEFANTVTRFHEDPRVTKPYSTGQVSRLHVVGEAVDAQLVEQGVELTMGGEPTFVSVDDMTSPEWTVAADGPQKRTLANNLAASLAAELAPGALVQRSQGKWYPGEALPRWQIALIWRTDGDPLWSRPDLLADPHDPGQASAEAAQRAEELGRALTARLGLPAAQLHPCYEDPLAALAADLRRPDGPRPGTDPAVDPPPDLVATLDGAADPVAWALPLTPAWWGPGWASARWRTRRRRLVLVPGDSPAGQRLPLSSLSWADPDYEGEASHLVAGPRLDDGEQPLAVVVDHEETPSRTAVVLQARDGYVHVFLPPLEKLEKFAELVRLLDELVGRHGGPRSSWRATARRPIRGSRC